MSRPTREQVEEDITLNRVMAPSGWKRTTLERYAKAYLELLDESERLKKDKEHWEDGWVEVAVLKEENAKLRKVVEAARAFEEDEGTGIMQGCGCAVCRILEAIHELDEGKP